MSEIDLNEVRKMISLMCENYLSEVRKKISVKSEKEKKRKKSGSKRKSDKYFWEKQGVRAHPCTPLSYASGI